MFQNHSKDVLVPSFESAYRKCTKLASWYHQWWQLSWWAILHFFLTLLQFSLWYGMTATCSRSLPGPALFILLVVRYSSYTDGTVQHVELLLLSVVLFSVLSTTEFPHKWKLNIYPTKFTRVFYNSRVCVIHIFICGFVGSTFRIGLSNSCKRHSSAEAL